MPAKAQPEPQPPSEESEEPADQTAAWRWVVFKRLGFAEYSALILAQDKRVEARRVEAALKHGCTHEQALRIFL